MEIEALLNAAHRLGVSRLKLRNGKVCEVEFFAPPMDIKGPEIAIPHGNPKPMTAVPDPMNLDLSDMPSDEEFKYYHSEIVPAPAPTPQEEIRNH